MVLKNVTINGEYIKNIIIKDDKITDIVNVDVLPEGENEVIDLNRKIVIPGVVDPHVHVRDLQQSYKEDWESFTKAAVRGGYVAVFDMPNTIPPTDTIENLKIKEKAAEKSFLNKYFVFGANGKNFEELEKLSEYNNVPAIKLFMSYTSSNDTVDNLQTIYKVFEISKKIKKPVILHCEDQTIIDENLKIFPQTIENHNKIRSREAAIKATETAIKIAKEIGNKIVIAHVSTAEEIKTIRQAKLDGVKVYCETTPHHFLLSDDIISTAGNYAKVNPPIRTKEDNEVIYQGILDGTVDYIGTDHAPHSLEEKNKPYSKAPSGFPGVETLMPLLLNLVITGRLSLQRVMELTSINISRIFKLEDFGKIKVGLRANIIAIDLYRKNIIKSEQFFTKAKYSPFENYHYQGDVVLTVINGKVAYKNLE